MDVLSVQSTKSAFQRKLLTSTGKNVEHLVRLMQIVELQLPVMDVSRARSAMSAFRRSLLTLTGKNVA
jgi:hypothetical protein